MLAIRFNRTGRKNRPNYRVVVQEHTMAPGGRHVEVLGSYDPFSKQAVLKADRIQYWIGKGAQASVSAHNLLVREGIVEKAKRAVQMPRPVVKEIPTEEAEVVAEEKDVTKTPEKDEKSKERV